MASGESNKKLTNHKARGVNKARKMNLDLWLDAERDRTARNKGLCSSVGCYAARSLFVCPCLAEKTNANYVTALLPSSRIAHSLSPLVPRRFPLARTSKEPSHSHFPNLPNSPLPMLSSRKRSSMGTHLAACTYLYATYVSRPLGNMKAHVLS